jgi:hypothetical protein
MRLAQRIQASFRKFLFTVQQSSVHIDRNQPDIHFLSPYSNVRANFLLISDTRPHNQAF